MTNEYEKEMMDLYKRSLGERQEFKGIVCPSIYKKPCRLCELCKEVLFNRAIPKGDPRRERASSLNSKFRYYSNVMFMTDTTEVVILEYGDKIFKQLLAMQMDEVNNTWKDFFNPIVGRNLVIERIQGSTKQNVDYIVRTKDPSQIVNPAILTKLTEPIYNLTNIIELIAAGQVKPLYQSKMESKVEVRFLPSWLGPKYAFKFFQKVNYHYNISEEEFKSCQAGEINPVRLVETISERPVEKVTAVAPIIPTTSAVTSNPLQDWGLVEEKPVTKPVAEVKDPDDDLPACYGEYDETETDCIQSCADWSKGCKEYRDKLIEKRRLAKKLQKGGV